MSRKEALPCEECDARAEAYCQAALEAANMSLCNMSKEDLEAFLKMVHDGTVTVNYQQS